MVTTILDPHSHAGADGERPCYMCPECGVVYDAAPGDPAPQCDCADNSSEVPQGATTGKHRQELAEELAILGVHPLTAIQVVMWLPGGWAKKLGEELASLRNSAANRDRCAQDGGVEVVDRIPRAGRGGSALNRED
jgi:rubredoxin